MAAEPETLVRYLRRLVIRPELLQTADAALLDRFISDRDERAFTTLVDRHGPMVLHVCRRVLGDLHDAEDAFQAAFLVLAHKAGTVNPREALTGWLHGVALRVALKARSARVRRLHDVRQLSEIRAERSSDPLADLSARELIALVDEEVQRLPVAYRLPVILCCLEGRSQEEAARQLGWTPGSVKGRLERGRARLHSRLVRRGLTLSAALVAVEVSRGTVSAAVVGQMLACTVRAALAVAAGQTASGAVSAQAAVLAGEVVNSIALAKLKLAAALVLATCVLATGAFQYRAARSSAEETLAAPPLGASSKEMASRTTTPIAIKNQLATPAHEANDRVEVSGRVLDPGGAPLAGAKLYVGYAPRRNEPDAVAHQPIYPLRGTSEADGRFGFVFMRSELDERFLDASRPVVVAVADGFGPDWAEVRTTDNLTLRLVEDFPLEGRILGSDRKPLAGARVLVRTVASGSEERLSRFLQGLEDNSWSDKTCSGPLPGQPPPVRTAADGSFRLTGVGRNRLVTLGLEAPSIPPTVLMAVNCPEGSMPQSRGIKAVPFEYAVPVSRSIRGFIRDKVTGLAVAGIKVTDQATRSTTRTDQDGRYELLAYPRLREFVVTAQPETGQPYFAAAARVPQSPNGDRVTANFDLVSGIPLHGRVWDPTTGKPPKTAHVEYYPLFPNAGTSALTMLDHLSAASSSTLEADGSYSLMVLPGPGVILVAASPRDSYTTAFLNEVELANLFNDGTNHGAGSWIVIAAGSGGPTRRNVDRYNALALINPDEKTKSMVRNLVVHRARPLPGVVVDPDGRALAGVRVSGLTSMPDAETLDVASFVVEGLNWRRPRQLSFYQKEKALGKVVTVAGDETTALKVQLEPCGFVTGRLLNKSGKPAPEEEIWLGVMENGLNEKVETDLQGRFRAALVPGLKYRLSCSRRLQTRLNAIEVESTQVEGLGDVLLDD